MKYCTNCGMQAEESNGFCPNCGKPLTTGESIPNVPVTGQTNQNSHEKQMPVTNSTAIEALVAGAVGVFFLHLILGIVAVILAAVAMPQIQQKGQNGKGLATAGLILGIIDIVYFIGKVLYLMND